MIAFKNSTKENTDTINQSANKSENDKVTADAGGSNAEQAIASYNKCLQEDYDSKDSKWKLKLNQAKAKDGITMKIWQRKYEGLKNDLIRIEANMQEVNMEDFV